MGKLKDKSGKPKATLKGIVELRGREVADQIISAHDYPSLGLEDDEYVIVDVERSKVGLAFVWAAVVVVSLLMIIFCHMMSLTMHNVTTALLIVLLGYFAVTIAIVFGTVASRIYQKNYMIITNQRAFTQKQIGPFATKAQVIELEHIEDVGVFRGGFLPMIFGYGEIRLSTERDESAYNLTFVKNPDEQVVEIRRIINTVDEGA